MLRWVMSLSRRILLCLACFAAVACTMPDRVVKLYQSPEFVARPFSHILVVGVHENADLRRQFEVGMVRAVRGASTAATASIEIIGADTELARESVLAAVRETSADAVLVTRLEDVERRAEIEEGRSTLSVDRRDDVPLADFFRYDYTEYRDPMVITTVTTVVLVTDLYNVADEARIWSVQSTSLDKTTVVDTIDSASRAISGALARDGLIGP